jgi:hypothetical protein
MNSLYKLFLISIFLFALVAFILLFFVSAPYGRFVRKGWGASLKSKFAWMIMEFPSPAIMLFFFITSENKSFPQIFFIIAWLLHYLHRTFVYPFIKSGRNKPFPVILVLMAFLFNILNGTVNGYGVFHLADYEVSWLVSWQFISGILLFATGFYINKSADRMLKRLRKGPNQEYQLPQGWLFNYISCPHYFGEIIEWLGWAVMTFSVSGFAFFVFTFANLFPRAISSHNWYKQNFPDYPAGRKAIIPFIL